MKYKTYRTTMGRKYRMRLCEDEIAERTLFRITVVALPFFGTVLLTLVWLWRG